MCKVVHVGHMRPANLKKSRKLFNDTVYPVQRIVGQRNVLRVSAWAPESVCLW
jgi:hypothetical protein